MRRKFSTKLLICIPWVFLKTSYFCEHYVFFFYFTFMETCNTTFFINGKFFYFSLFLYSPYLKLPAKTLSTSKLRKVDFFKKTSEKDSRMTCLHLPILNKFPPCSTSFTIDIEIKGKY